MTPNPSASPGEFLTDRNGVPYLDAAGQDVMKAFRFFTAEAGEAPAIVSALLTVAWAVRSLPARGGA